MNEDIDTVEAPVKGKLFALGPGSAVWLGGGLGLLPQLRWCVLVDEMNQWRGHTDLPPGVFAHSIVRLAADRNTITVATKDRLHVWSRNNGSWCSAPLEGK